MAYAHRTSGTPRHPFSATQVLFGIALLIAFLAVGTIHDLQHADADEKVTPPSSFTTENVTSVIDPTPNHELHHEQPFVKIHP